MDSWLKGLDRRNHLEMLPKIIDKNLKLMTKHKK